jgi:PAS domain S-box-containing protein
MARRPRLWPGELDTTPEALFALVHPDDQSRMQHRLLAHLEGVTAECECVGRLRRQDGTYQWRRERCVVVERGPDQTARRIVGLGTHITDLGQAGDRAHPWEHVFDQTQFGLSVASVADDTILAVNEAYARMHGYAVEELLGRPVGITCELPAGELAEMITRINENGHVVGEFLHRRKNGTTFPALHEIAVVRNAQGAPVSRVGLSWTSARARKRWRRCGAAKNVFAPCTATRPWASRSPTSRAASRK